MLCLDSREGGGDPHSLNQFSADRAAIRGVGRGLWFFQDSLSVGATAGSEGRGGHGTCCVSFSSLFFHSPVVKPPTPNTVAM